MRIVTVALRMGGIQAKCTEDKRSPMKSQKAKWNELRTLGDEPIQPFPLESAHFVSQQ